MKSKQYFIVRPTSVDAMYTEVFEEFVAIMVAGAAVSEIHVVDLEDSPSAYTLDVPEDDSLCWFLERTSMLGWVDVFRYNTTEDRNSSIAELKSQKSLPTATSSEAKTGRLLGLNRNGKLRVRFPKLTEVVGCGPFLFAINKDSKEEYNDSFDLYTCFYDGSLRKLLIGKGRSSKIQKVANTVQYYLLHAPGYNGTSEDDFWRNMQFDSLGYNEWVKECREYGVKVPVYIDELLKAVTDHAMVGA